MVRSVSSSELVSRPPAGRVFRRQATGRLADVAPSGRVRLDALARWLQDVAVADWVDSGLDGNGAWVVRRMRMRVERFPRMDEPVEVETFCSGTGSLWAERRTTVRGDAGALVEAVALWIHLAPDGSRPQPLPDGFEDVYGEAIAGRRVRARLRHPDEPPAGASRRPWRFRAADLDVAAHVNNAVYWEVIEEDLGHLPAEASLDAEVEHRAPADAGDATILSAGPMRWLVAPTGELLATMSTAPPE